MRHSIPNIKLRIALHSFGGVTICLILFLFSFYFSDIPAGKYAKGGILTASTLATIFNQKKYLTSLQVTNDKIVVQFLSQMMFQGNITLDKTDLDVTDIKGTNWWFGELHYIIFSNKQQSHTFAIVDNKLKQSVIKTLEQE